MIRSYQRLDGHESGQTQEMVEDREPSVLQSMGSQSQT